MKVRTADRPRAGARLGPLLLGLLLVVPLLGGAEESPPATTGAAAPAPNPVAAPIPAARPAAPVVEPTDTLSEIVVEAPEPRYVSPTRRDKIGRIWAPVFINGRGPFKLVLDTGASNSAVNARVAERLNLPLLEDQSIMLRGVTGSRLVPTIPIDSLIVGDLELQGRRLPIVTDALGGAEGVLGTEGLLDKRVYIDFARDRITIFKSHLEPPPPGFTAVPFKIVGGLLMVVNARIGAIKAKAIIDTGGQGTLGNIALREALLKRYRETKVSPDEITGATLDVQKGDRIPTPPIELGALTLRDVRITIGDMYIFQHWHMTNEPTILVGMDLLGLVDTIIIDYRTTLLLVRHKNYGARPGRSAPAVRSTAAFRTLAVDERALALKSPPIAAEPAVAAEHPMTGHEHRDAVGSARGRRRPHRLRRIDRGGDFAVAHNLAGRDREQEAPDPDLKRRAAQVERQVRPGRIALEMRFERSDPRIELGGRALRRGDERRSRKLLRQLAPERRLARAELREADAAPGRRHQERPERRRAARVGDRLAGAARAVGGRGHPEAARGRAVDAARRLEARGIDRLEHAPPGLEAALQPSEPRVVLVGLRRDAEDRLEGALQMRRREMRGGGEARERQGFLRVRLDVARERLDSLRCPAVEVAGMAALAGAKPRPLGGVGRCEKPEVLGLRGPRGTGRAAVDASCDDAVDERAIEFLVARRNGAAHGGFGGSGHRGLVRGVHGNPCRSLGVAPR
jgi:predicted aspartyl protease